MRRVIERQRKAVRKARREGKRILQMLLVVDDLADDKRTMGCGLIRELMLRGRHIMISTILSTQKNARNRSCMQTAVYSTCSIRRAINESLGSEKEEFSASADPKVLQNMYNLATSDPYGFIFFDF